jgi:hypothetical protein
MIHHCPHCNAIIKIEVTCHSGILAVDGVYTPEAYAVIEKEREARHLKKQEIAEKKKFLEKSIHDFESSAQRFYRRSTHALLCFIMFCGCCAALLVAIFSGIILKIDAKGVFALMIVGCFCVAVLIIMHDKLSDFLTQKNRENLENRYYAAHPESIPIKKDIATYESDMTQNKT